MSKPSCPPGIRLACDEGALEAPPQNGRIRFGVSDVEAERRRLIETLGLDVSPVERVEGVVAYCNFDDPWGNKMGLFQDLSKY